MDVAESLVETAEMQPASPREMARLIDHTLLKAEATQREVEKLCAEALQSGFYSVCVNGSRVALARRCVQGSSVKVAAVVGFPLGAMSLKAKCAEAEICVADGAEELDLVMAVGLLKDGARDAVREEIAEVVRVAGSAKVKVILECCLLTREEKILACQACTDAGAAMVKTSTGFGTGGANLEDVRLMRSMVPLRMGVKASGGIRDTATALAMVEAGATRLGTSAGMAILAGMMRGQTEP
ncbi:MAG: deoxyribose-phosphate aldolase [Verrucomicrobiales bacterium]|nr:deoxyribose-phosphate aldolase [Verrucomicrobiales bacterium]